LRAVDEMIDAHEVSDATWADLAAQCTPPEIFELLFVIGGYLCLAGVLNSIGLRGAPPATPPDARHEDGGEAREP
jgi:hypothetical protein